MERREFLYHSSLLLTVAILGTPGALWSQRQIADEVESVACGSRLIGHKRHGCARPPSPFLDESFLPTNRLTV